MQKCSAKRQSIRFMRSCRQGLFPTPDSVVYNNSIFNRDTQENHVYAWFLVSLYEIVPCDFAVERIAAGLCWLLSRWCKSPLVGSYSLYRRVKNWYAWLENTSCFSALAEVQYPKPEHEEEPFWTGFSSRYCACSRRALWPHVWPQTEPELSETVELRASKSERNIVEMAKSY